MQGQRQFTVLDELSKVNTKLIVMVGNNLESDKCEEYIKEHSVSERKILYGFQNSAGHREGGKAVVGLLPVIELFLGGLHEPVDTEAVKTVKEAFAVKGYKITEVADMRSYYFYHIAEIMPYILMYYKVDCDIKKLTRQDIKTITTASGECFEYLKGVGMPVMPVGEDKLFQKGFMGYTTFLLYRFMSKTILGKLMVSDHAKNGVAENKHMDAEFEKFRAAHPGKPMPTWDNLRKYINRE